MIDMRNSPQDELARLTNKPSAYLAEWIINDVLNRFIAEHSTHVIEELAGVDAKEVLIPFHGWFWRYVNFFTRPGVTIADNGTFVGICESNKWDYPSRRLTDDERARFLELVWVAYRQSYEGGDLYTRQRLTHAALAEAGEYIASLEVGADL